jgi:hypothetical protein
VSILITLCILTAFLLSNQKKHVLPGILLAFATAIKLYPALFILHFILKRDLRTCVSFLLALFIFYFAFPATILGFNNWFAFENATSAAISNANWITNDANSQFIAHVGLRWFSIFFNHAGGFSLASILTVIGYAITISCIGMMWAFQKNALYEKQGLPLVAIFLVIPFVLKTSWPHYFVYLPFCQAAVLSYSITTFGVAGWHRRALIILPIFSILFSSVFFFNLFPDWIVYNSYGMLFFANAFLLIAMYGITIMTHLEQHTWN